METFRRVILKTVTDNAIAIGVNILVIGTYLIELTVILPRIYGENFSSWYKVFHVLAGTYILFSLIVCFWKFVLTDSGVGTFILPSILKPGWRFCWKCEANFPPRSYHCLHCKMCVLVRDHHCMFAGNCVGYKNRRYFMLMNLYFWISLLYANILNMDFMWELYQTLQYKALLTMFAPLVAWILNVADGDILLMALFASFCVVSFLYATAILLFHLRNTLMGRTTPEVTKKFGLEYDMGIKENIKQTFGINWKLGWICPLIPSPLPGNGIDFKQITTDNVNKKCL